MSENTRRDKLKNLVNSSGFPLQIGLQYEIEKTMDATQWEVLSTEHPWKSVEAGTGGFIDLVLQNVFYHNQKMVIECKRVRDTEWVFLNPDTSNDRRHVRFFIVDVDNGKINKAEWLDKTVDPPSPEIEFCVVHGQEQRSKPMLERIASEIVEATEVFAQEEIQLYGGVKNRHFLSCYFPVIVTTAELIVCKYKPEDISLDNGEMAFAEFKTVPFVRFRKSLTNKQCIPHNFSSIRDVAELKERTVFVVNALNLVDFLTKWELQLSSYL